MTTQLPHDWRSIRTELNSLGMRVIAGEAMASQIRELTAKISELKAEARAIHDEALAEDREPSEEDLARFHAIMGKGLDDETGEIAVAEKRLIALKNRKAAIDRMAIEQHEQNPTNPLDGPGLGATVDGDNTTPALAFRDQNSGRMIRALGLNDRFAGNQPVDPYAEEMQPSIGERIVSHLNPDGSIRNAAQFEGADGTGGFILPPAVLGPMVDLARPAAVSFRAGATTLPMTGSELHLVQQLSDPEVLWTSELGKVPSSTMSFGKIVLRPKKLACLVPISLELLEDAVNAGQLLDQAIRARMAVALDQAILSGAGSGAEPQGIRNTPGVNTVTASDPIADYSDLEEAIEKVESANYPGGPEGMAWLANPRDASQFRRLQDNDLQPLMPTPGAAELTRYQTTSLPIDLGAGSDEGEMIVGDMSQVVVGLRTNATLRFVPAGTVTDSQGNSINAVDQFATILAIHMRADVAVIRPEWLCVVDGVKWPTV